MTVRNGRTRRHKSNTRAMRMRSICVALLVLKVLGMAADVIFDEAQCLLYDDGDGNRKLRRHPSSKGSKPSSSPSSLQEEPECVPLGATSFPTTNKSAKGSKGKPMSKSKGGNRNIGGRDFHTGGGEESKNSGKGMKGSKGKNGTSNPTFFCSEVPSTSPSASTSPSVTPCTLVNTDTARYRFTTYTDVDDFPVAAACNAPVNPRNTVAGSPAYQGSFFLLPLSLPINTCLTITIVNTGCTNPIKAIATQSDDLGWTTGPIGPGETGSMTYTTALAPYGGQFNVNSPFGEVCDFQYSIRNVDADTCII